MMTFDGQIFLPGGTNAPSLEAIALGLARRPRFAGQTSRPFNVLAHSFLVADLIEDPAVKVHGLLHDAAEAVVGDIPTPWKTSHDEGREIQILDRIYASLGLDPEQPARIWETVKDADRDALQAEATLLMPPSIQELGIVFLDAADPALALAEKWIQCNKWDWQQEWCRRVRAAV